MDGGGNGRTLRAGLPLVNGHRQGMGNFFPQHVQTCFANQLRSDLAFIKVGDLLRVIMERTLGKPCPQGLEQGGDGIRFQGADAKAGRLRAEKSPVKLFHPILVVVVAKVVFSQYQKCGTCRLRCGPGHHGIFFAGGTGRIRQAQNDIGVEQSLMDGVRHRLIQGIRGHVDPGGVDEEDLT